MTRRNTIVVVRATDVSSDARSQKAVRWLADAGWDVVAVSWPRGGKSDPLEWDDVELVSAPFGGGHGRGFRNLIPLIRWSVFLFRVLWSRRRQLAAVHAMDLDTAFPSAWACRSAGAKFVYDICDFYPVSRFPNGPAFLAKLSQKMESGIVRRADAVVMPTESRMALFHGVLPKRLVITPNVPNIQPQDLERKDRTFTVLYVGVLSVRRGLCEIVHVVSRRPDWKLVIGGTGEDEEAIKSQARSADNVEFVGKIPYSRVIELTACSDALVVTYDPQFPNHRHSSPNKLYEGMMLGVPLVVAKGTGVDDDVVRYGLGEVVTYGDEAELEAALERLAAKTEQERSEFLKRSSELFETEFNPEAVGERLTSLYCDLCGDPR